MAPLNDSVAVVGAGPAGLIALKELRELGFNVTAFERRSQVGGIWTWTEDSSMTSALKETRLCNTKFSLNFSDMRLPPNFSLFPASPELGEYFRSYARHFDLERDIEFNKTVTKFEKVVTDSGSKTRWQLTFSDHPDQPRQFDRVVWATGSFLNPRPIHLNGQDQFAGRVVHSQYVKDLDDFAGKNVLVLGVGNTAGDVVTNLVGRAGRLYLSHRRGAKVISRNDGRGVPAEAMLTNTSAAITWWLEAHFPKLFGWIINSAMESNFKQNWGVNRPEWGFNDSPSLEYGAFPLMCSEDLIPHLKEGTIESVRGISRISGPSSVVLDDGRVLEDIDAIITCTGYYDDMPMLSDALTFTPGAPGSATKPLPNLYMGIFPPEHADSLAIVSNVHLNAPQIPGRELACLSVAHIWAGNSSLPPLAEMQAWALRHNDWLSRRVAKYPSAHRGDVIALQWHRFVHEAAGTGLYEHIGWGWAAWKLWWTDRELYNALAYGPTTSHGLRVFETGKRRRWEGARQAVIDVYKEMEALKAAGKKEK